MEYNLSFPVKTKNKQKTHQPQKNQTTKQPKNPQQTNRLKVYNLNSSKYWQFPIKDFVNLFPTEFL